MNTKNQIFEPLFSTKGFGVGLGLPIVKDIIDKHNGNIIIKNNVNGGTKVTLAFPKTDLASEPKKSVINQQTT